MQQSWSKYTSMELSEKVHPQLAEQYNRYRFLFLALCVSGFLPLATLLFLYFTGPGLAYMEKNLTTIVVIFVLQVPLCVMAGYLLGVKRMKYLKRSTYLVGRGVRSPVQSTGLFRVSGQGNYILCCVDIFDDATGEMERFMIIPTKDTESAIKSLPELGKGDFDPSESRTESGIETKSLQAFVDSDTGKAVAVEQDGVVFFVSPPVALLA